MLSGEHVSEMMRLGGGYWVATNLGSPYLGLGVYLGFPHLGLSLHTLQSAHTFCATALFVIFCSHTHNQQMSHYHKDELTFSGFNRKGVKGGALYCDWHSWGSAPRSCGLRMQDQLCICKNR